MTLQIRYFASVKEALDMESERVDSEVKTVADLIAHLSERGDNWRSTLQQESLLIAVNQTISATDTPLKAGDEVAFFPPVTGG